MIHVINASDPLDAHDKMCERLVFGHRLGRDFDWTHGTEVGLSNVVIDCDTIDFEADLKRYWIPPSRWRMMVRQYIDPSALDDALDKIEERMSGPKYGGSKGNGIGVLRLGEHDEDNPDDDALMASLDYDADDITVLKTRMVQGKGVGRGIRRRWGSCMLNLSFRKNPVPTVSLHSRTTYFGYLAILDMAVARTFATECAEVCGIKVEDIRFVWSLDLAQFHGFRSLAWILGDPDMHQQLIEDVPNRFSYPGRCADGNQPGWRRCIDGFSRIVRSDEAGILYGDGSFSSFERVRRRYHTEVMGIDHSHQFEGGTRNRGGRMAFAPLPQTLVSSLDFTSLGGPTGRDEIDDEDDDE